jgi:hypothetical protein
MCVCVCVLHTFIRTYVHDVFLRILLHDEVAIRLVFSRICSLPVFLGTFVVGREVTTVYSSK